ncbi:hypothetical protein BB559_000052 [Furculomyces boomerangus]|uniref:Retrovirus-related Pol polyprotein from transposon TNT 1-94-like beta-barrel domain-containing protein n=1 Tax=Furculomyces boomerangus TaxID=61424 RepID=A0A2T9Z6G1_9FUNG|nr:hypothetical protein BB559_000052 [Furculomyces boomerangus]
MTPKNDRKQKLDKSNTQSLIVLFSDDITKLNIEWVVDFGATTHMCNDDKKLSTIVQIEPKKIHLENNSTLLPLTLLQYFSKVFVLEKILN